RESSYSWGSVLSALANVCGRPDLATSRMEKPFTLLFEEMVLCSPQSGDREDRLKSEVARLVERITPGTVHRRLRSVRVQNILTSNYDYALERAVAVADDPAHLGRESRYSLFRRRQSGHQFIWHIHGEGERPSTITL